MTTKQLGIMGLIGAPCLAIGLYLDTIFAQSHKPWWMPVWGILYITGWMATMESLRRLNVCATDRPSASRFDKLITPIVLVTLTLANVFNVWEGVAPDYRPALFYALDANWPLSNLLMLGVGIAVLRAKKLPGWERWVPLLVGCWLPVVLVIKDLPGGNYLPYLYSAVAWTMLAVVSLRQTARQNNVLTNGINQLAIENNQPVVV